MEKIKQCKINHGIMPFWTDMTKKEAEEIKAFSLKNNDEWMNYFYWSKETETEFLRQVLSFYPKGRKHFQVAKYYNEASLNWFPTNTYHTFLLKHRGYPNDKKVG